MNSWRAKLKHFLILSSAGKPIYSRHGDDQLVTNYIGLVQTIISFYQSTNDTLRGFTAGGVRFVVMSKGPLNLVAITRLPESDSQLRTQLEALYMQILSTLTLPSMERMFAARANYDLRRPLQGTDTLLSALADGFTRGSPSTLLSALECLKLPKSLRATINNTMLKTRSENLLYGLIVASGKLVSVVRPKKHSLHPGDLQLIFNMLFEAGSVKAGGGENWIPLCLPGFNNTGYLYMYVSFLNLDHPAEQMDERPQSRSGADGEVAVLLISAAKEGFFEMRGMRDELVQVCVSSFCVSFPSFEHLLISNRVSSETAPLPPFTQQSSRVVQDALILCQAVRFDTFCTNPGAMCSSRCRATSRTLVELWTAGDYWTSTAASTPACTPNRHHSKYTTRLAPCQLRSGGARPCLSCTRLRLQTRHVLRWRRVRTRLSSGSGERRRGYSLLAAQCFRTEFADEIPIRSSVELKRGDAEIPS